MHKQMNEICILMITVETHLSGHLNLILSITEFKDK